MKQLVNKPNHVYANNSYYMIIRGFMDTEVDLRYSQQQQQQQQQHQHNSTQSHACVQTIGIEEPDNQSLKHVNGKLHIQMNKQNLLEQSGESDENMMIEHQIHQQQQQNDKISFRPLNFLKSPQPIEQEQEEQHKQIQAKNYELNDNNLKKYLNSGFATPSSETSGSYYQPKLNLTFSTTNNHHYEEERDSTDEAKKDSKKFSHYPHHHVKKMQKSKSLQKIEFPNADDDDDDDDDDSNNEQVIEHHYGTLPAPKPRIYGSIGEDKPSVKPRKPKPKPRSKLSMSDENSLEKAADEAKDKEIIEKPNRDVEQKIVKNSVKVMKTSSTSTSTPPTSPKPLNQQSSSPQKSPSSSISVPSTSGFVSQMKSKFESQIKSQELNSTKPFIPSSKLQIQSLTAKLASSTALPLFKFNANTNTNKVLSLKDETDVSQSSASSPPAPISIPIPEPISKSASTENESEYMNIDNLMLNGEKFQTIEELNNSGSIKLNQQQAMLSEFRILDKKNYEIQRQRSLTPSTKSLTMSMSGNNNVFIKHVPDPVDVVNIKYEGERRVLIPGYLTSADILRNSLISNATNVDESNNLTLKEKLRLQQPEFYNVSRTATPPSIKSLATSIPIHIVERYESKSLSNKSVDIGNNSLFQKVTKDNDNDGYSQTMPQIGKSIPLAPPLPPPMPPPQISFDNKLPVDTSSYPIASKLPKFSLGPNKMPSPPPAPVVKVEEILKEVIVATINQTDDDDDDAYSFKSSRSKSMSGVLKLDEKPKMKAIINFDLIDDDYEVKQPESAKPETKMFEIESNLPKIEMAVDVPSSNSDCYEYEKDVMKQVSPKKNYTPRQPPPPPVAPPLPPTRVQTNSNKAEKDGAHYAVSPIVQELRKKQTSLADQKTTLIDLLQRKESVTGSFDPSDFDSFDEADTFATSTKLSFQQPIQLPKVILSRPVVPETPSSSGLTTFKSATMPIESPKNAFVEDKAVGRFDPNDFDSFDEDEKVIEGGNIEEKQREQEDHNDSSINNPEEYNLNHFNNTTNKLNSFKAAPKTGGNFFRNALNRLSTSKESKKRSSSVPPSKILNELNNEEKSRISPQLGESSVSNVNMKTLHLMNKMQIEHEEKQKRRKLRLLKQQQEQQQQQQEPAKTPKSEKKFLNSLMSSLFSKDNNSSSSYEQQVSITTTTTTTTTVNVLQKNESRRLSLRKLKAKDKAKKLQGPGKGEGGENASDGEIQNLSLSNSSQSLNFYRNPDDENKFDENKNGNETPSYIRSASFDSSTLQSRVGKIADTGSQKVVGNEKLDIMKQIRAELDEEIKSRFAVDNANKKFDASTPVKQQPLEQQPQPRRSRQDMKRSFDHETNLVSSSNESNSLRLNSTPNRKIRSKSVTFLDDITTDDEILGSQQLNRNSLSFVSNKTNDEYSGNENSAPLLTNSVTTRRKALLKTGDARYHCGALTGVGPIRSIMKKSATDLSITLNTPLIQDDNLPRIELMDASSTPPQQQSPVKSLTTSKPYKKIQSDL